MPPICSQPKSAVFTYLKRYPEDLQGGPLEIHDPSLSSFAANLKAGQFNTEVQFSG